MKTLAIDWTKHIQDTEKKSVLESAIRNSTTALTRLREIIEDYDRELSYVETKPDYENPAWAYKQAHINGRRNELKRLKDLLSFIQ